ncbi:MAG: hypothetical protein ACNA7W_15115 [Pseudomonadales bacterium]
MRQEVRMPAPKYWSRLLPLAQASRIDRLLQERRQARDQLAAVVRDLTVASGCLDPLALHITLLGQATEGVLDLEADLAVATMEANAAYS